MSREAVDVLRDLVVRIDASASIDSIMLEAREIAFATPIQNERDALDVARHCWPEQEWKIGEGFVESSDDFFDWHVLDDEDGYLAISDAERALGHEEEYGRELLKLISKDGPCTFTPSTLAKVAMLGPVERLRAMARVARKR